MAKKDGQESKDQVRWQKIAHLSISFFLIFIYGQWSIPFLSIFPPIDSVLLE